MGGDSQDAPDVAVESSFEAVDVPEYRDFDAQYEGSHERGDRRIVRTFAVTGEEVVVDAYYFLDGSRLDAIREGTVEVEEAERRAPSVEAFCRQWHERDPDRQLGSDFEEVIANNSEKAWVRRHLDRES